MNLFLYLKIINNAFWYIIYSLIYKKCPATKVAESNKLIGMVPYNNMRLDEIFDIYELISIGTRNISERNNFIKIRQSKLNFGFKKVAFDTRRIDQETEYNPRRGLQNYQRSQAFLSEVIANKIKNLAKLRDVLCSLKDQYGKEYEWQDSNARILLSTIDKGLRINEKDGDYTDVQPAMGSLNYIDELLHVRYRLTHDDLCKIAEKDLKNIILSKDEDLIHKDVNQSLDIKKSDISSSNYSDLLEKLFGGIKATSENKDVERTITITIRDKINDK